MPITPVTLAQLSALLSSPVISRPSWAGPSPCLVYRGTLFGLHFALDAAGVANELIVDPEAGVSVRIGGLVATWGGMGGVVVGESGTGGAAA